MKIRIYPKTAYAQFKVTEHGDVMVLVDNTKPDHIVVRALIKEKHKQGGLDFWQGTFNSKEADWEIIT